MRPNPKPQEMYRHFKGNIYQIRCLAKHSETGEMMVVYQAMYDTFQIYVRPLAMFMEEVDSVKYPDAMQKYRFALLEDPEPESDCCPADMDGVTAQNSERTHNGILSGMAVQLTAEQKMENTAAPEEKVQEADEQLNIDPLVMEFLDADTYEQRLNILAALRHRITDEMINTMAVAVDLEIKEGDVEERCEEFKNCLLTFEKYECNRLR